jgi:hypothetical protein
VRFRRPPSQVIVYPKVVDRAITLPWESVISASEGCEKALRAFELSSGCRVEIDLAEVDFEDGESLAKAIEILRHLRIRAPRLTLIRAPQMLCHNLYRVGLLDGPGAIELIEMRQDEPASS